MSLREPPPLRLTTRDKKIVHAVYTHRALTSQQINRRFFPRKDGRLRTTMSSRCLRRLRLLTLHGLLQRREQPVTLREGRKPLVYFLGAGGVPLLAEMLGVFTEEIDWHPRHNRIRPQSIHHLLATNDVRIAIELAAQRQGVQVTRWLNSRTLQGMKDTVTVTSSRGAPLRVTLIPDGYCILTTAEMTYHHFLEVDMGTETGLSSRFGRRDFARKIRGYLAYVTSGLYQQRYGANTLRVLTVTTGPQRMHNLRRVSERVGGNEQFWFTTFDRVTASGVLSDPIWTVAGARGRYRLV